MANALLFNAPQAFDLPVSLGRDIYFDLLYKPLLVDTNGNPILDANGNQQFVLTNYPTGATLTLKIDDPTYPTETTVNATINGWHAVFQQSYTIADTLKDKTPYRVVMVYGGVNNVVVQGKIARKDP
jgi:hypothetical protein